MRPTEATATMVQEVLVGATETFVDRFDGRLDGADAMFLAVARRSCAAIRDHRSLELV